MPSTVDPLPPDRVTDYRDQQFAQRDIADEVAARVDLERFGSAITGAIAAGVLAEATWMTYSDHRLRVVYLLDRPPVATRYRVAAYRAAKKLQPLIDMYL
ncbi:MAG TPA: hypothetical protein PLV68_18070, partial [Ilumatobacteraceae bacterium]|nr:hypothetical protein [Ilumatobacteraceae bacterium]